MHFCRYYLHVDLFEITVTSGSSIMSDDTNNLIEPPNGFASDDEGAVGYDDTLHKIPDAQIPPPRFMISPQEKELNVHIGGMGDNNLSDILSEENEEDFTEGTTNALKVRNNFRCQLT